MNKEELNTLLDNIYELEGLVHLAMAREDCPEMLPSLIIRKAESLNSLTKKTMGAPDDCREREPEGVVAEEMLPEDNADMAESQIPEAPCESYSLPSDSDATSCLDAMAYDEEDPVADISQPIASVEESVGCMELETVTTGPASGVTVETAIEDDYSARVEPVVRESVPGSSMQEREIPKVSKHSAVVEPRGKLVFTINDRYRFKRDLFCNSDADFNTTLALVASMENYDEAEDYFLDELQWNAQREEVTAFLDILKNYFKE